MSGFSVKVDGLRELDKALRGLDTATGLKVLRGAAMDAMKPFADDLKESLPESEAGNTDHEPGFMKSRVRRRSKVNKTGNNKHFKGSEVVKVSAGVFGVPYVGSFHFGKRKGQKPNPLILDVWNRNTSQALYGFKSRLALRIKKAAKAK